MNDLRKHLSSWLIGTAVLLAATSPVGAQVPLGAAAPFAILGGTAVTLTGGSVTVGDVGVFPGSAYTNTGDLVSGAVPPATNAAAVLAHSDFLNAYATLQLESVTCTSTPGNLSGLTLSPGVYCLDAVAKAGTLTLNGPSTGVWVFLVNGALTATNFTVVMAGGAVPCNVFWAPSAAVTLTTSAFKGNILAGDPIGGSITMTASTLAGRALANVAITMTGASVISCQALSVPPCDCNKGHEGDKDHDKDCKDDKGDKDGHGGKGDKEGHR
jgi:Ice-binding-like